MDSNVRQYFRPPPWLAASRAQGLSQSVLVEGSADSLSALWTAQLVRLWLCHESDAQACGHCLSCHLLEAGNHPDYLELVAKNGKTLGIEQVREGIDFLAYTPQSGPLRVLRVLAAEQMSTAAANALLKGLEEPPPRARILLLSGSPSRLLPTIRSRCQRLGAPIADVAACADYLRNRGVKEEDVSLLAQQYADRPARAVELAGSEIWGEVPELQRVLLPAVPRTEQIWPLVAKWGKEEERILWLRDTMLDLYRDIFRLQQGLTAQYFPTGLPAWIAARAAGELWLDYQAWLQLATDLRQNLQIPMRLERLLWRWFFGGEDQ